MARDIPAGKAFIEIFLKAGPLDNDLRRMRRRLMRMTNVIAGVGAAFTAVGVAAGSLAVAGIIKATNAAGDFAETVAKFETVFGDRADFVRKWAEDTAEALGITRQEALATLSGFQDLFVPLGIGADEAEKMSMQLTQLSVDLASFNNLNSPDVVRDLQAAMTGSSETMKKYGVIVDAAAVKQELLNRNLDPKTATNAQKAMARLELIMRSTTAAQGDAEKTAGSYNNTIRRIQTSISELFVDIGEKFQKPMQDLATIAKTGLEQLRDALDENMPDIAGLDDQVIELAKSGNWQLAGEIIGLQLKLGIRNAIGPTFFDVLEAWTKRGGFGLIGGLAFRESREQIGAAGAEIGGAIAGTAEFLGAGEFSDERGQELLEELRMLNERAAKIIEAQNATKEAVEDQEGARLQ